MHAKLDLNDLNEKYPMGDLDVEERIKRNSGKN
jgi:hypothetical protein